MTREEAILAMINGKEITNDEFDDPDNIYCIYDRSLAYPFRYINGTKNIPMHVSFDIKNWRLKKHKPKWYELKSSKGKPVWVRDNLTTNWTVDIFEEYDKNGKYPFMCKNDNWVTAEPVLPKDCIEPEA